MPRGPRLDAPDALHHVMVRGIERRQIFIDDADREDLLRRIEALVEKGAFRVYAWALMPNHFHLLLRTGAQPISRSLRSLLTGYAVRFNRRHARVGHLFQNRFKSIVCEKESYFLELVRYIHLNPVRAGLLAGLEDLDRYPYAGHSALVGAYSRGWQETDEVLEQFSRKRSSAIASYRRYVAAGIGLGRRPELTGGGLVRSVGGWKAVAKLRNGREVFAGDERILGGTHFVLTVLKEVGYEERPQDDLPHSIELEELLCRVCENAQIDRTMLGSSRLAKVCRAREAVAYLWIECLGRSGRELARALGARPSPIYKAAKRGRACNTQWKSLLRPTQLLTSPG